MRGRRSSGRASSEVASDVLGDGAASTSPEMADGELLPAHTADSAAQPPANDGARPGEFMAVEQNVRTDTNSATASRAAALVSHLASSLVDSPHLVQVHVEDEPGQLTLALTVEQADVGKIIGREGRVVNAIRALAQIAGRGIGKPIRVDLANKRRANGPAESAQG